MHVFKENCLPSASMFLNISSDPALKFETEKSGSESATDSKTSEEEDA